MRSFDGSSPTAFALQKRHLITAVSFWMCDRRRCELLNIIVLGVLGLSLLLKDKMIYLLVCLHLGHRLFESNARA